MLQQTKPDLAKIPGGWEPKAELGWKLEDAAPRPMPQWSKILMNDEAYLMENVLEPVNCKKLVKLFEDSHIEAPVGIQGKMNTSNPDEVGSKRATAWSEYLADQLWKRMRYLMPQNKVCTDFTSTDWWQGDRERCLWRPCGISPLLRFMRYQNGGQHFAHYDAGFIYPDDNYRTLMSFVLYLSDAEPSDGGSTRFIMDGKKTQPVWERNHDDWDRPVNPSEVITEVHPKQGNILFFDHRLCHDVEPYHGENPRIIVRGDIIFTAVDVWHEGDYSVTAKIKE